MRVRVVSFGTNWWAVHSRNLDDPYCFRRRAAWFNSAGLKYGRRLRLCWVYPGHIRFNQNSGFQPERPLRAIGRTFLCTEPNRLGGRTHVLFVRLLSESATDRYLVTVNEASIGRISFTSPGWRSPGVQPISVSLRGLRYEAMVLMGPEDWIETDLGRWFVSADSRRLVLTAGVTGGLA
jgi:hypothetical protein